VTKTVAVYGGSFNPPHIGHVMAVTYVLCVARVDEVVVVPCFIHPFAKQLASFEDRLAMCRDAFAWIPRVTISDVERRLGGESLTLRTIQTLRAEHADWSLRLVVGSDVIPETPRWHGFDRIRQIAPLLVLDRPGAHRSSIPSLFPDVSSSAIRSAIAAGDLPTVQALLPAPVFDRIRRDGLYRAEDSA
jgi:nicotinate-nucleotide adenylyltransferase